jgi:hypothetical protein
MLNDVWVNGQGQDVWCRSNQIIKDTKFYGTGETYDDVMRESCFLISLEAKWSFNNLWDIKCDPAKAFNFYFCMCSN